MRTSPVPPLCLAIAQGHAVFLDCGENRYFALSPEENEALLRLLAGEPIAQRAERALSEAIGLEATREQLLDLLAPSCASAPRQSRDRAAALSGIRSGWSARVSAVRHLLAARAKLKLFPFRATLEHLARIQRRAAALSGAEEERVRSIVVGAHQWALRHFTGSDACLVQSLALACHLRSSGCAAELVIAVRAEPFAAHAWVRSQGLLLNEEPDHAAPFQPILIL